MTPTTAEARSAAMIVRDFIEGTDKEMSKLARRVTALQSALQVANAYLHLMAATDSRAAVLNEKMERVLGGAHDD